MVSCNPAENQLRMIAGKWTKVETVGQEKAMLMVCFGVIRCWLGYDAKTLV